jgi:L-asparaginase
VRHVTLITTGGTIEKTFNEASGTLENRNSIVRRMLRRLRLEGTRVGVVELLSKDSLHMTDEDRAAIARAVVDAGGSKQRPTPASGVVVLHGTDTLSVTGEHLLRAVADPRVPIVLTGAMRPYEMKRSDALQNLTEAIFATGVLAPGVYCVAHGRALPFPGVVKDRAAGTFVRPQG